MVSERYHITTITTDHLNTIKGITGHDRQRDSVPDLSIEKSLDINN